MISQTKTILHIGSREMVLRLRDQILRLHGFLVQSTLSRLEGEAFFQQSDFDLVLVDVERQLRVPEAEELCQNIRMIKPEQKVSFVCNYQVSLETDCPDEIIHAEFNPAAFVEGVKRILA